MTGIAILQVILSAALFIVLWRFLTPIVSQFVEVVSEREQRTERSEEDVFKERSDLKTLIKELADKRHEQRARGVKIREEIISSAKAKMISTTEKAKSDAVIELDEFRSELFSLKANLERDIQNESESLSRVIMEKVSAGSGLNTQTIH